MRARTVLAVWLVTTACTASAPTGLVLEGVVVPDGACLVAPAFPLRVDGLLDTTPLPASRRPEGMTYRAAMRLRNHEPRGPSRYPRIDEPHIEFDHFVVEIRHEGVPVRLGGLPNPFQVPADGRIGFAGPGGDAAVDLAYALLLPETFVAALDAELGQADVELWMQAVGTANDGMPRTSTTAMFPLRLCLGCLVTCAPSGSAAEAACIVGQDDSSTVACE